MQTRRKHCVAMLLAGGQGSRLMELTTRVAKPAVPFGGKYRIIDFPLSNCVNSRIDTVGILTQYQPLLLNNYIGNGSSWSLNRNFGGAHILPPYLKSEKSEWYKGTANAVYQNIHFIEQYSPELVLVLSGDHIYKMDYRKMIEQHKVHGAECTIAVIDVSLEEASRFGIMNCDEDGRIIEFEEKPKEPKSTSASMGIYVFSWPTLKKYLVMDEHDDSSVKDFGKNVIPRMLKEGVSMFAYSFSGYWKDVGTVESLWQANMDLLDRSVPFMLDGEDGKIYLGNNASPPTVVSKSAGIKGSMVAEGCEVTGDIECSVVSLGCKVAAGASVKNSVIMPGAKVLEGASVNYAIVGENAVIERGASVIGKKGKIKVIGSGRTVKPEA